jgi:hypothetical protein
MTPIKSLLMITLLLIPLTGHADSKKEDGKDNPSFIYSYDKINFTSIPSVVEKPKNIFRTQYLKDAVDETWSNNITPLKKVVGEKWASLMTSSTVDSEVLGKAFKETWIKALEGSKTGEDINSTGLAISRFITDQVDDTQQITSDSAQLISKGDLVDGLWYLSLNLIKKTDDNLGKLVQESELINTIGKITATSYGGTQGAAAYASWYAYKETKDPEMALKIGIMSGTNNVAFNIIDQKSIPQLLKNNIITGIMAGLSIAIGSGDEEAIKNAFLKTTETALADDLVIINPTSLEKKNREDKALSEAPVVKF